MGAFQDAQSALAKFDRKVADLETVVADQVKLLQHLQHGLRNELLAEEGVAGRNLSAPAGHIKSLKELTTALSAAVAAETALHKAAKDRAKALDWPKTIVAMCELLKRKEPEQARELVVAMIQAFNDRMQHLGVSSTGNYKLYAAS